MSDVYDETARLSVRRSLSSRLLILTVVFVMLAEVLIFVPSVARYRASYLQQMLDEANLAVLSLLASPDEMVSEELKITLLRGVGVAGIVLKSAERRMLLLADDMPPEVDETVDLRDAGVLELIMDALETFAVTERRMLRVIGPARTQPQATVEVLMDETGLRLALFDYGRNIFLLSLVISVISASLLFLTLRWLMVRPMRQLTENLMAFRRDPESAHLPPLPKGQTDEIGLAAHQLDAMERDLRQALVQKNHLAALGTAVSKINHDLRGILATAQVVSEFLANSDDPVVKRMAPRLIDTLDRASNLCSSSLKYGRADEPAPDQVRFPLSALVAECGDALALAKEPVGTWMNEVPGDFEVLADREQLYRVLINLGRNALQAAGPSGTVRLTAERAGGGAVIRISDDGPGLPERARENLFKPFVASARSGGTGLGLAIARDLVAAHGGTLELEGTGIEGTVFRITLPD